MTIEQEYISTRYGNYGKSSRKRLNLAYDYESAEIEIFHSVLNLIKPSILFDIGANIGLYTIYSSQIESITNIYAYEASPDTFSELAHNIQIQQQNATRTGFTPRQAAVSNSNKTLRFLEFKHLGGQNAVAETTFIADKTKAKSIEIESCLIDEEVELANETLAIKIDVEGHEFQALEGMKKTLVNNHCFIQIEAMEKNSGKVDSLLKGLGYTMAGWVKHDFYFHNFTDVKTQEKIQHCIFEELAYAMQDLMHLRRMRRTALQKSKEITQIMRYETDPVSKKS